jgi:hypothetical protein
MDELLSPVVDWDKKRYFFRERFCLINLKTLFAHIIAFALTCFHGCGDETHQATNSGESGNRAAVFQRHNEDAAAQAAEVHTEI